jgi:transcriptional regulator with XRE-family HTH domain
MLKTLLEEHGISVRALSRKLNIPQSTLNSIVTGKQPGSIEQLLILSKHFGISVEYLATGEDGRPPTLSEVFTEEVYDGWLKVKIERAIPNKRKLGGSK